MSDRVQDSAQFGRDLDDHLTRPPDPEELRATPSVEELPVPLTVAGFAAEIDLMRREYDDPTGAECAGYMQALDEVMFMVAAFAEHGQAARLAGADGEALSRVPVKDGGGEAGAWFEAFSEDERDALVETVCPYLPRVESHDGEGGIFDLADRASATGLLYAISETISQLAAERSEAPTTGGVQGLGGEGE